ncbi:MAG: YbaN family protein [Candidatus Aminicenantes bacterium]|nr:YbaN family protein [Candidatus Aminicenantes bacterium]
MKKTLFILLGSIFTGLAFLGIFLPLLPTTPFLLLAAFFYLRSSERLYHWLLNHKIFGKYLQNYLKNRTVPINIKIFVLILLWITILLTSVFVLEIFVIRLVLILIATAVTIHILSLKTLK